MLSDSIPQIGANVVHAQGGIGSGAKVCIVDTGIASHTALPSPVAWRDFINNQPNPYDDHGHGTHVSGIAASRDSVNKGVAPNASLMVTKVCTSTGSCPTTQIIAGIDWCVTNGADVISLSLGGGAFTGTCDSEPTAQAANNAFNRGVFVAAASGNDGFVNAISAPACGSNVTAVGAVDKLDRRTVFSNEGTKLGVVAPGVGIVSTLPGNTFGSMTGTSMATPHVSGLAALLKGRNASLTPAEIRSIIQNTAKDLGALGFDTIFGHGRINASAAYQTVSAPTPPPAEQSQTFTDTVSWTAIGGQTTVTLTPQACPGSDCYLSRIEVNVEIRAISEENPGSGYMGIDNNDVDTLPNKYPTQQNLPIEGVYGPRFTCGNDNSNPSSFPSTCSLSRSHGYNLASYIVTLFANPDVDGNTEIRVTQARYTWTWRVGPPPNQPPVANAGQDQVITDFDGNGFELATLNGTLSFDPDGTIVAYEWKEGASVLGTSAVINANFSLGTHNIVLTVTDNNSSKANDTVIVTVKAPNKPPVANAGPDRTVNEDQVVTFDGSASSDPDGTIVSYSWNLGDGTIKTGKIINHSYTLNQTFTVTLTVTDNEGATATDTAFVNVNNVPPIANAGPDQTGSIGQILTFDGSGSTDTPSDISTLTYSWNFGDSTSATGKIASHAYVSPGTYIVTLTVTDNNGASSSDTAIVTIIADAPPAAPTGLAASGGEEITLTWNANTEPDLSGYEIHRSTSSTGTSTLIATVGIVTEYMDTSVSEGAFFYKIKAFDQAGNRSPFSDLASATISGD